MIVDPVHYLPFLERKIAALDQAAPLVGWELPDAFATLRRLMEARMGKAGKREFVQVLRLLESFDFKAIPSLNKMLVLELARCEYIDRRENVIALSNSGTGKTHIALALGLAACQKGITVGGPGPRVDGGQGREVPAALPEAVGQIQVADHRRTRLRAALEDRRRTAVRGV